MKRRFNLVFLILVIITLVSCGGLSKNYQFTEQSKKGLVIASVSQKFSGDPLSYNVLVKMRKIGDKNFFVKSIHSRYDTTVATVHIFELPPGEYEFQSAFMTDGNLTYQKGLPTPFRFSVNPGKANYVGNLSFTLTGLKSFRVKLVNNNKLDIAEFRKRFPNVQQSNIQIKLASK